MSANNYSITDRALHRLALGGRSLAEMSFDLEKTTRKPDGETTKDGDHVFIAGLARAGTTILMRRFYASGHFGALTYKDMPFVLAPGLWSRLSRRGQQQTELVERAHGDGVMVNADSPESLDEVFWRVFCAESYLHSTELIPHDPDSASLSEFRTYVAAILQSRDGAPTRYLSKTNNSILRLSGLRRAFPQALILVPFREPMQHANSLMKQHRLFKTQQGEDKFVLRYMNWLAHHEFGQDHRPFVFDGNRPKGDPETLAYWLDLWCGVYQALLDKHSSDVTFVSYDRLCIEPAVWSELANRAGLPRDFAQTDTLRHATHKVADPVPDELAHRAAGLHQMLLATAV